MDNNANRYTVSSRFIILKIFLFIILLVVCGQFISVVYRGNAVGNGLVGFIGSISFCSVALYYVFTRPRVDYDDIAETVYVVDAKKGTEIAIPVESIDKILYSSFGMGQGSNSYIIVYRDLQGASHQFRLFPIMFDNSIKTIKRDAKLKNPDIVIRNWSIGF